MMRWNGWGMGWTWLVWVVILVAVMVIVYLARPSRPSAIKSAEEILRERFASRTSNTKKTLKLCGKRDDNNKYWVNDL